MEARDQFFANVAIKNERCFSASLNTCNAIPLSIGYKEMIGK